ncbi:MAG: chromate efflux transporter [Granulosicoccaceae bacterium]
MTAIENKAQEAQLLVSMGELFGVFLHIGLASFGGPAAQIALMHKVLVEQKKWLKEPQFLHALSFCMLLPGPEAMQLATYAGWRLRGFAGGLLAGLLFVLPGAIVIFILASIYAYIGDVALLQTVFLGVKAAVLIIVVEALLRISKKALLEKAHWALAGVAFVGLFFFSLPYPLIVLLAAVLGALFFSGPAVHEPVAIAVKARQSLRVLALGLFCWFAPLLLLDHWVGAGILTELAAFFSKLAVVTFGGAYAVLAYMAQDVVELHGWLSAGEMLDGLGLAETTPGPLILVTQFVGFLAAFREGGLVLGLWGGLITLWVTFVPCFIWIFVGAPYIEWISTQPRLRGALQAITASVVGVILHLSVWFGLHVLFAQVEQVSLGPLALWMPSLSSFDWRVMLVSAVCAVLLLRLNFGVVKVLLIAAASAWLLQAL